jgi:hypothetical protein
VKRKIYENEAVPWESYARKTVRIFNFHQRSQILLILALKTDYNNENFMPHQLMVDVPPLLNKGLFKIRLIWV